ncbi:MAG: UDP-N-acetylmuramoyl-L-alanyl-D-glutamate--2,6-diaminopimelate ligase [Candidatus Sericytochromatia bacterium]|nr:UDP-N-acetylmuramoyl-L-alanyl-D-glutamate--2,6-diaminopimelate ligase [Candidatus Sericytochromatia bacterium]
MRLEDLQALIGADAPLGASGVDFEHSLKRVVYDARQARHGDIFCALPGTRVDGHQFLGQAALAGAGGAIVSRAWAHEFGGEVPLPCWPVADTRVAMAKLAATLEGHPSRRLKLIGVTGTNGKTTTTFLIRSLLGEAGVQTGLLGTLGAEFGDRRIVTGFTTPQSPDLQGVLSQLADCGAEAVAMEVSSHAIEQARVYGCEFQVALFTNLTRDHLDYHGTMEQYAATKRRLVTADATGKAPQVAVINLDDPQGQAFLSVAACPAVTYGIEARDAASLWASEVVSSSSGSQFLAHWNGQTCEVRMPLPGRFNVYNALAALATGLALGHDLSLLSSALERIPGVPGRVEVITPPSHPFTVWVDYAHTPDGLENVLQAARNLNPKRLITVFGCGGDRDRTKRPMMGEVVARLTDLAIVTSDNPRSEEPAAIIREVLLGMRRTTPLQEVDREAAIFRAIEIAQPGDLVLIAGKGHETSQVFSDRTIHFDDREVARRALKLESAVKSH